MNKPKSSGCNVNVVPTMNRNVHTVFVRIEAPASISIWKVLTRPLFKPGFYFIGTENNNREMATNRPLCTFEKESIVREHCMYKSVWTSFVIEKNFR